MEGPPSRPTTVSTQQAMLAYLHDMRCIASSTRANLGPCSGMGNSHSFGKRSGQPFLKHVKKSSTDMILGNIVRRPQDFFFKTEISVVFPVDERNGCRY